MVNFPGFEVLGRVAEGSTGVVWQVRQVELGRLVAIKELSHLLLRAPGFLERFRAEAQMLAGLDDPHVARVYDYVEEPARAYLVQEWVEGASLDVVLRQHGSLTGEQSLGVLRGGLMGLAHAHSRGLVHRDISPTNILLDRSGVSKLVDFGLAAPTQQGITPGAATSIGTPAFSSPEAVTGAPMTTRSDVYSAAAVLFLLLSGRLPYAGNAAQVLQAHTSAPVPVLAGHGPELASLLQRALSKNPAERPADAAAFLAELEDAATRRYGAGWLSRASVAGLVTAGAMATAAEAAVSGAAAAVPTVAGADALAYGSAGGGVRTAARLSGRPRTAVLITAAVVVAVIAVTLVVVTNRGSDNPVTAAADRGTAPGAIVTGDPASSASDTGSAPQFSEIVYGGTMTNTNTGETMETEIAIICQSGECVPNGWGFGGHSWPPLVREGPGTFSAILPAEGTPCDDSSFVTAGTVMITLDQASMTLIAHGDGITYDDGHCSLDWPPDDYVFQGDYLSGELPGI